MKLEQLKNKIINKSVDDSPIVFLIKDDDFIATQYYRQIAEDKNLDITVIESLNSIQTFDIFGSNSLYIYRVDKLDTDISKYTNLIVITKKINIDCDYYEVEPLKDWHKLDYVMSICEGLTKDDANRLVQLCSDIYRLDNEINKIKIFNSLYQHQLYESYVNDKMYDDLTDKNIFDFSNSIQKKDVSGLLSVYKQLFQADVEPLGLVTILYNNFRKMISVWCQKNPTPDTTGLKMNQIQAISKLPKVYSYNELIDAFKLVSNIDYMLKNGLITNDMIVDYLVINLMS